MEVIIGKLSGFCPGVQKAVQEAENLADENKNIYCLGEIVHNKQVVNKLEKQGVKFIEEIEEVPKNSKLIFRAHGVPKSHYEYVQKNNIQMFDCTCQKVLELHQKVEDYKEKYFIFYTGKSNHPETIGTISFAKDNLAIIENEIDVFEAVQKFKNSKMEKAVLISQTTYSVKRFEKVSELLKNELGEYNLHIDKTICSATDKRQEETEKLSKIVDSMIIIGGKNSSNSNKLYEIAKANCENTFFIETKKELEINKFENFKKVGIMAGASTPQELINEVEKFLKNREII